MTDEKTSKSAVASAAKLAMLEFDERETEELGAYLAKVLKYMENLNELVTDGVEASPGAPGIKPRLRPDKERESDAGQKALDSAPQSADGFFSVPRVIED